MPTGPETFRVGVNYWPSGTAMDWLASYEPAVVRGDFARIAAAGMDTVRVFLRWEDLQPTPGTVDSADRHALHRPHERRELDPRLGHRRRRR